MVQAADGLTCTAGSSSRRALSPQQYPSILEIHGGPQTQYGNMYMHEFHYLAAAATW